MIHYIIKYRWRIISFCLFLGMGFGALIPLSETDPDIRNYIPATMHSRCETDKIESEFGVQDMVLILFSDSSLLESDNLLRIREIDKVISRFNGVSDKISPFTVRSTEGEGGTLVAERLIRVLPADPEDVKGTAMLIIDNNNSADEMWIYLPALKKTKRIVSSEKGKSFMSSEFTNADMSSPDLSDFTNRHPEGSGSSNQWIIESSPVSEDKADEYGYTGKISFITKDDCQVTKMEFYNFDNELFKIIEMRGIYPLPEGKFIVRNMTAANLVNGRKSVIDMTSISVGARVDDALFSLQNPER